MKKIRMGILLLAVMMIASSLNVFAEPKKSDTITGTVKVTLKNAISKPEKEFNIVGKDNKKVVFLVNKLDAKNYVLAPLSQDGEMTLKSSNPKNILSVKEYKGEVFVQTKENMDKIKEVLTQYRSPGGARFRSMPQMTEEATNDAAKSAPRDAKSDSPASSSETNVQVKGVDEADIVKVIGDNIYYIAENKIHIAKADNGKLSQVTTLDVKEGMFVRDMYVDKNRLIVIGAQSPGVKYSSVQPISSNEFARVIVYDMSNPKAPKEYRSLSQEGYYSSSRKIGDQIYLVTETNINNGPGMPVFRDTANSNKEQRELYDNLRIFPPYISNSVTTISSFSVNNKSKAEHINYVGQADDMYMNESSLYISYMKNRYFPVMFNQENVQSTSSQSGSDQTITVTKPDEFLPKTVIKKFSVNKGKVNYVAEGEITGHLINQFAMDESGGFFRVAYTKEESQGSEVAVFDGKMQEVGKLTGIAPGERIYSVRFMGEKLYLVTFKQVDPFFVIDMKNPKAPKILGYLKIPGYSNYLHPYDDTHIIGFGNDTAETGFGGVTNDGMKIAMFDVSDVKNPKQTSNVVIGKYGTYSALMDDHKALMYNKEKSYFGFPIMITEKNPKSQDVFDSKPVFQGGYVYDITKDYKIQFKGKTSHMQSKDWNWQYEEQIQRLVYIGDYIYSVSDRGISSNRASDMKQIQMLEWK
ncbi:MAG: beta-propeller domain-containing protein [Peptostreptococcaceae bacterium]|nr:beta-propeller domain-containing protein [Peptostreptococcaceae bacterium]